MTSFTGNNCTPLVSNALLTSAFLPSLQKQYLKTDKQGEKRKLLSLMFTGLFLDEGKLAYSLTSPFKTLFELIKYMNSSKVAENQQLAAEIFEPEEKLDLAGQTPLSDPRWEVLLRD